MKARNLTDINSLFEKWPLGAILTVKILKKKGFTELEINNYQKSKVITPLGKEIFKKTSEQLSWEGVVYGLQQHYENRFIVGGKTALDLLMFESPAKEARICLVSNHSRAIPQWIQKVECGRQEKSYRECDQRYVRSICGSLISVYKKDC